MPPTPERSIVLRLSGELSTKSDRTRRHFVRRLRRNIADALDGAGIPFQLVAERDRLYVHTVRSEAAELLARVFGLQGVGVTEPFPYRALPELVERGRQLFADSVSGRTFAVRTRRVGPRERHALTSADLDRALGAALLGLSAGVDLDDPEVVVPVELRPHEAHFYLEPERSGPGGLPLGTAGRCLALVSGGFDSAVAAWLMMRRGVELDFLFFNLAGPPQLRGVQEVLRVLTSRWAHGSRPRMLTVDLRPLVAQIETEVPGRYWQILLKRVMFRAAELLAGPEGYAALVTGESIGQVSTQALGTLGPIAAPVRSPLLRPLIGHNKEEIIELSRHVGTHDASAGNPEFCSLGGGPAATRIRIEHLDALEERLDRSLLERMVEAREVVAVGDLACTPLAPSVEIEVVPEGATVVDLRSRAGWDGWHYPEALHLPFDRALASWPRFPGDRVYVLYCEVGLKSAYLAERMQAAGFEAYHFSRGLKGILAWARGAGVTAAALEDA